jgi:hypothetical protein
MRDLRLVVVSIRKTGRTWLEFAVTMMHLHLDKTSNLSRVDDLP